ncbi:MAG: zf-TFIIB domain-containing protein [Planctomycetota bacterium]
MSEPLNCPVCSNSPLDDQLACEQCKGRFVSGEAIEEAGGKLLRGGRPIQGKRKLDCPACGEPMQEVDCRGLLVDHCRKCNGLWLDAKEAAPGQLSPLELALFTLSLPERTLRGAVGGAAGALHETAQLILPPSLRNTKLFHSSVTKGLRFLIEDIAGIENRFQNASGPELDVARAAVGSVIDNAGLLFLHASPIWVLAAVSDLAHGTKTYVRALQKELIAQGVLDDESLVDGVDELLERIQNVSGRMAESVDQPPLSVDDLRRSVEEIRGELRMKPAEELFPKEDIDKTWSELEQVAEQEDRSLFEVSSLVTVAGDSLSKIGRTALASVTTGADLLYEGVLKHYRETLHEIDERGYFESLRTAALPYLEAARAGMTTSRESWTERLLSGRLVKDLWNRWRPK